MGNSLNKYFKDPELVKLKPQFTKIELYMLALIFRDLSARQHGIIDKETFLQFFPLTGLWGERLFEKFDLKHTGNIDFYEFVRGIATCCNSSEDEKIHLLFSLYDMDQDGFIKKKEMITMLYNYPKNHIKFITDEIAPDNGERLEQVTEAKRQSLNNLEETSNQNEVIPHHLLSRDIKDVSAISGAEYEELVVAEEQMGYSFLQVERDIRQPFSYFVKKEEDERNMRESMTLETERMATQRIQKKKDTPAYLDIPGRKFSANLEGSQNSFDHSRDQPASRKVSTDKMPSRYNHEPMLNSGIRASKGRDGNSSTLIMDQSYVISTTVNTRVKEYASFMFKTFDGANSRGKISYDEFKQWISMHPIILKVFDDSFHQDLWSTQHMNNEKMKIGSPVLEEGNLDSVRSMGVKSPRDGNKSSTMLKYREKPVEYSGWLYKKGKKTKSWKKRYFELDAHFLVYYDKKESKYPKGIMFLEGCYIDDSKDFNATHKHGFVITHKSESYQPHYLYCSDKGQFDEWMSHLRVFQSSSIMDLYAFQEKIGTGKFSVVYRAITKDSKQSEYAIKVIDKKSLKPEEKEFLISETCVMKVLDHPSMIKLIDTIETRTNIYIVTEIVKDGDLFDYIIQRDFLEEHTASLIMKKLLISIDYLHNTGIIHRDIKPENILITLGSNQEIKELKIIDFGFAKLVNEGVMITDTCGTPNYVAPEVLNGHGYDKKADIWSLGIIMFLMIRGLLPFDDNNVKNILENTVRADLPLDDDHWRNVSPEGRDLVRKFLRKDPHDRIEIKDALRHPWIKDREKLKHCEGVNKRQEVNDDD